MCLTPVFVIPGGRPVRGSRGRLPKPPGTAGVPQESNSQLRGRRLYFHGLNVREVRGVVVCGGVRCGDVVLRVPLRRKGWGGNGYSMDDIVLARFFGGGTNPPLPLQ